MQIRINVFVKNERVGLLGRTTLSHPFFLQLLEHHFFTTSSRLERCWDVKTAVTKCILDANGTNDYKLPHGIKHEEPISIDMPLDSDDADDPVARTLDYEGLHASLPSSPPR